MTSRYFFIEKKIVIVFESAKRLSGIPFQFKNKKRLLQDQTRMISNEVVEDVQGFSKFPLNLTF